MTIGAVGAYQFQPYVYNTNTVSAASMNKLSRIPDDVLDQKIDYSGLTDESRNVNPLQKGQTLDFQGMLQMQMQRGQNNAARVMKPSEETQDAAAETAQAAEAAAMRYDNASAQAAETVTDAASADNAGGNILSGNTSYQMQQALNAYEMFMTA